MAAKLKSDEWKKDFADRLGAVVQGTQEIFAQEIGISQGALSDYLDAKSLPGTQVLRGLLEQKNVNINWLLTGRGEAYLKNLGKNSDASESDLFELLEQGKVDVTVVPYEKEALFRAPRKSWFSQIIFINAQHEDTIDRIVAKILMAVGLDVGRSWLENESTLQGYLGNRIAEGFDQRTRLPGIVIAGAEVLRPQTLTSLRLISNAIRDSRPMNRNEEHSEWVNSLIVPLVLIGDVPTLSKKIRKYNIGGLRVAFNS